MDNRFAIVIPPDLRDEENEILRRLRTGEHIEHRESVRVLKDGKKIDVSITVVPVRDAEGKIIGASGIVRDITEKKRAEAALRDSEERFRLAAQAGKMFAYDWDVGTDVVVRSGESVQILGIGESTPITARELMAMVHPEDRERVTAAIAELSPEKSYLEISYRRIRPDGTVIWVERIGRAHFDEQGRMVRMIGMTVDITERKLVEEALSKVSQRLIEAHEEERTRIAQDLHDYIDSLVLLSIYLDRFQQNPPESVAEVRQGIGEARRQVQDTVSNIQALSHRLYPLKLEVLGLAAAVASFCKEFSGWQKVEIEFHSEGIPKELPKEISLCLFRVLQEALQNAANHSGSRPLEVSLSGEPNEIRLTVSDWETGFDPASALKKLSIISMRERLKRVDGELSIESQPQCGTTINARVPLTT